MIFFWSTEGNIMSTSPNISKFTGFCEEWNYVQNMIFYSRENPFFDIVFSSMVGGWAQVKYQLFSKDFIKIFYQNTKIIQFSKSIFRHSLLKYGGWVGLSKISTFFKRFYQNLNDMKFFKICYHTLKEAFFFRY